MAKNPRTCPAPENCSVHHRCVQPRNNNNVQCKPGSKYFPSAYGVVILAASIGYAILRCYYTASPSQASVDMEIHKLKLCYPSQVQHTWSTLSKAILSFADLKSTQPSVILLLVPKGISNTGQNISCSVAQATKRLIGLRSILCTHSCECCGNRANQATMQKSIFSLSDNDVVVGGVDDLRSLPVSALASFMKMRRRTKSVFVVCMQVEDVGLKVPPRDIAREQLEKIWQCSDKALLREITWCFTRFTCLLVPEMGDIV